MGPDWPGGRRSVLRQRGGNSRSFFFLFFFFSPLPPKKKKVLTLLWVLLHSFLGVPFMTVRLQVHSPFSFSTFSLWTLPSLPLAVLSFSLPPPSLSLALLLRCSQVDFKNLFFLIEHNIVLFGLIFWETFCERFPKERADCHDFEQPNLCWKERGTLHLTYTSFDEVYCISNVTRFNRFYPSHTHERCVKCCVKLPGGAQWITMMCE